MFTDFRDKSSSNSQTHNKLEYLVNALNTIGFSDSEFIFFLTAENMFSSSLLFNTVGITTSNKDCLTINSNTGIKSYSFSRLSSLINLLREFHVPHTVSKDF